MARKKKIHPSTVRLLWWLGAVVAALVIIIMWYIVGAISLMAHADKPASTIETGTGNQLLN